MSVSGATLLPTPLPFPRRLSSVFFISNHGTCPCYNKTSFRTLLSPVKALSGQKAVAPGRKTIKRVVNGVEFEIDEIMILHERVRRAYGKKGTALRTQMNAEEAEKYIEMVKQQQQRGLKKLREKEVQVESIDYKVDPYSLSPGDYVVHRKVGVGKFVAIKFDNAKNSSKTVEYVFIEYADGMAKLSVKQAAKTLYRYSLPHETKKPRTLSKLHDTSAWEKRKTKGKIAVQKMVVDLIELYLHRLKQTRPSYPKVPQIDEFAAQFPYKPTSDQEQAFIDVYKDLTERETPMDRLICGDVGFGKTEVALRAIFSVVSAGKQAMILAPTVVLAKQHFEVISHRFSRYPEIKVGLLSRFQTKTEKEECLAMIRDGLLHIIIGTHTLLGVHVAYDNLGLLVVDEEQRFGVKQKERIASFKTSVDVLTLSATPIPRTLYLALTGFRDARYQKCLCLCSVCSKFRGSHAAGGVICLVCLLHSPRLKTS